jgi:hypothetical protein
MLGAPQGLEGHLDHIGSIEDLHDAIANDEYVQYGAGYDPNYGEYRGFGDDSWIDEMDSTRRRTTRGVRRRADDHSGTG